MGGMEDGGAVLWHVLQAELTKDESAFKARILAADMASKTGFSPPTVVDRRDVTSANENAYWNGCKFVNATVVHLTCPPGDQDLRLAALAHTSHSLGGTDLPPPQVLKHVRRVDALATAYAAAWRRVDEHDTGHRYHGCRGDDASGQAGPTPLPHLRASAHHDHLAPRGLLLPGVWTSWLYLEPIHGAACVSLSSES